MMVVSLTLGPSRVSRVPSLDNCAVTLMRKSSESNIAGFNSTAQVSITLDPMILRELATLLVSVREDEGTAHVITT